MTFPVLHHLHCPDPLGGHRLAWWEWNATGNPEHPHVVVCVHGLTRQARDFDVLAHALCTQARVVCPDMAGRGHSDWLFDPMLYQLPTYVADMLGLLPRLRASRLDWVGASMGGLIGMAVAGALAHTHSPLQIHRLVLNDVGPALAPAALERINAYVGTAPRFADADQAIEYLMQISAPFGPHTPAQWRALCEPMLRIDDVGVRLHYDPAIAAPLRAASPAQAAQGEASLWALYDRITAPTLLLRGAESDLLTEETAQTMTQRGPCAQRIDFAGVGHAPTLISPEQVQAVCQFLLTT